jgi:predicted nucleotidyltransferase
MTRLGPLDLLGAIGVGHNYEDLLAHTLELRVSGMLVRVLDLETLIRTKVELDRDKDRAVISILRRTLEEKSKM